MDTINKIVLVGTAPAYTSTGREIAAKVFCKIKLNGKRLSITGVVGPRISGNCMGSCGQIVDTLEHVTPSDEWSHDLLARFREVWKEWHLNDMQAGSPAQRAHLKSLEGQCPGYPVSYYDWAREQLKEANLQPDPNYIHNDKPYSYGSAWLRVDVPDDVIEFLRSLPDSPIEPAWV